MDGNNNNNMNNMPDLNVLKGSLAVIFGIVLVVLSYSVILRVLSLVAGVTLMYVGFVLLNMRHAVTFIDSFLNRLKQLLSK